MPIKKREDIQEGTQTFALPPDTFTANGDTNDHRVGLISRSIWSGYHPREVPTEDLLRMVHISPDPGEDIGDRYAKRITSPLTAIRAKCVDCQGGSPKDVRECPVCECPNWPFRMGTNPFFGKLKEASDDAGEG